MNSLTETKGYTVGVDIGGSHITTALVSVQSHTVLKESYYRERVDSHGTKEEIIDTWSKSIINSLGNLEIEGNKIGIAIPGPFDYHHGICLMKGNDKYTALYGLNVKELLSKKLGISVTNIILSNDAGCFLKGEVLSGAAKGYSNVIGIILGTGLGTATYKNGISADADLWQMPFRDGIAEDYLSTRWFVSRYQALADKEVKDAKEISALYATDDNAKKVFHEFGTTLGEFIVQFVDLNKPEAIVLGGNICKGFSLFEPQVKEVLQKNGINLPVVSAILGEHAPIIGACT